MNLFNLGIAWPFLASVIIALELIIQTWMRRRTRTSLYFLALLAGGMVWTLAAGIHLIVASKASQLVWFHIMFAAKALLPPVWLLMAMSHARMQAAGRPAALAAITLIPALTVLLVATNPTHGLMFTDLIRIPVRGGTALVPTFGTWFPVHLATSYVFMGLGLLIYVMTAIRSSGLVRRQSVILGLSAFVPIGFSLTYYLGGAQYPVEYTSIAFSVSCIMYSVGLYHYKLLDLRSVAREEVVDLLDDAVIVTDPQGTVVDVNPAALVLSSVPESEVTRTPVERAFRFLGDVAVPLCPGETRKETVAVSTEGNILSVDVQIQRLLAEDDRIGGFVYSIHDVTVRKEAEAALRSAKERAEEVARMKTAVITNISHELRTPLAGIIGLSSILESELASEQGEFASLIRENGQRLQGVLNAIIQMSELQSGRLDIRPSAIDLPELAEATLDPYARTAAKKGLSFTVKEPDQECHPYLDADRVATILENLVDNAIKYTEHGGIEVGFESTDDQLVITVTDTGCGMEPRFRERLGQIFERQEDALDRVTNGLGLGMPIAFGLIEAMHGTISVESTPDAGTRIEVRLPAAMPRRPVQFPVRTSGTGGGDGAISHQVWQQNVGPGKVARSGP